ncbi:DUF6153 family protein [Micromonospora costi]|uniref:Uncharacterized protein n=1 Tax=Micromonospora costi TaxID=1530042 RepID=A0A3A9ZXI2_9ACTN|nr:DUF6153 family protein [Micromonospora costi]RKN53005.1 hypothetical protein D7193_24760 [Micromonospora costi]
MSVRQAIVEAVRHMGLPRLMLLVLLALGVAGMHTLGHVGDTSHHLTPAATTHMDEATASQTHAGSGQPAATPGSKQTPGHGLNLDLFAVCLAVLGAVSILLWAALTGRLLRDQARPPGATPAPQRAGRGPPPAPIGLRLAAVSVSRT